MTKLCITIYTNECIYNWWNSNKPCALSQWQFSDTDIVHNYTWCHQGEKLGTQGMRTSQILFYNFLCVYPYFKIKNKNKNFLERTSSIPTCDPHFFLPWKRTYICLPCFCLSVILSLTISLPSYQFILIIFLEVSGNALVSSQSSRGIWSCGEYSPNAVLKNTN